MTWIQGLLSYDNVVEIFHTLSSHLSSSQNTCDFSVVDIAFSNFNTFAIAILLFTLLYCIIYFWRRSLVSWAIRNAINNWVVSALQMAVVPAVPVVALGDYVMRALSKGVRLSFWASRRGKYTLCANIPDDWAELCCGPEIWRINIHEIWKKGHHLEWVFWVCTTPIFCFR